MVKKVEEGRSARSKPLSPESIVCHLVSPRPQCCGKGTATPSSILGWTIPRTEEPGGLQSMGSQRAGHDWSDLARKQHIQGEAVGLFQGRVCFDVCSFNLPPQPLVLKSAVSTPHCREVVTLSSLTLPDTCEGLDQCSWVTRGWSEAFPVWPWSVAGGSAESLGEPATAPSLFKSQLFTIPGNGKAKASCLRKPWGLVLHQSWSRELIRELGKMDRKALIPGFRWWNIIKVESHVFPTDQFYHDTTISLLFSRSAVSDSLWPPGLRRTRLPCPSLSPGVCSDSCPLGQWCHPTISSSVLPFSFCPPPFPASESFPMSWRFASGCQSIGTSASASVLPMNIQSWFPLGLISFMSLQSKGLSRVFSSTTIWKHRFFSAQPSLWSNSHIPMWLVQKPQLWLDGPLSAEWCLWLLVWLK